MFSSVAMLRVYTAMSLPTTARPHGFPVQTVVVGADEARSRSGIRARIACLPGALGSRSAAVTRSSRSLVGVALVHAAIHAQPAGRVELRRDGEEARLAVTVEIAFGGNLEAVGARVR